MSAPHRLLLSPLHHATAIFQHQHRKSATIPLLFNCCLLVPMLIVLTLLGLIQRHRPIAAENSANTIMGMVQFPYRYWHCRDGVHFQYGHLSSARTSIGIAAMAFIFSMGTCQVPVPVLALPQWHSFPVWVRAKCPNQYWHDPLPTMANIS